MKATSSVYRWFTRLVLPIWPGFEINRIERRANALHERLDAIEVAIITSENPLRWFLDSVQASGSRVRLTMRDGAVYEGSVVDEGLMEPRFIIVATSSFVFSLRVADIDRFEEVSA